MHARQWLLVVVLALVAVAAARALGLWAGSQFFSSQPAPPPALVFSEDDLKFGPIPESEEFGRELRLTNTSAEPVTIARFNKSCSCLGIEPAGTLTVPPGETAVLRIMLKSIIPDGAKFSADGLFNETVSLDAVTVAPPGVQPQHFTAKVRFTVRPTVQFDPPVAQLGIVSHREIVKVKTALTLLPPIKDVRVLPHPDWAVTITPRGEGVREITATPTRPGDVRVVNDQLQIVPVGSDGEDRPARPLALRGEISPDVVSSPPSLLLGRVASGSTVEESFHLMSLTRRKFTILSAESQSPDAVVGVDPMNSHVVVVRLPVRGEGEQERQVVARVEQDDGSILAIPVTVRFIGERAKP